MRPNPVRDTLRAGGTAYGTMASSSSPPGLAEVGADFVLLDTEHSGVGIETVKVQIAASRASGIVPMVRVPGSHYHLVAPDARRWGDGLMCRCRDRSSGAADRILVPISPAGCAWAGLVLAAR